MPIEPNPLAPSPHYPVGILRQHGRFHVLAGAPIPKGAHIMDLVGELSSRPSRYSVQVDVDLHVETWVPVQGDTSLDSCQVRYMNHSCKPNTRILNRQVIALRHIEEREELTFDYNTTEWEMAETFVCTCGHCDDRRISGFKGLSPLEQEERRDLLPPHLQTKLASPG